MGTRKKKERRREKDDRRDFARRVLSRNLLLPEDVAFKRDENDRKMSEILIEFAEPLFAYTDNEDQIYAFASLAWNAAFLPKEDMARSVEQAVSDLGKGDPMAEAVARVLLASMMLRKLELYREERRRILGYEFVGSGEERVLNVVSGRPAD